MNARRDKQKQQRSQLNSQLEAAQQQQKDLPKSNARQDRLGGYLVDVSKYVLTGVVIASLFEDVTDKTIVYLIGIGIVVVTLWAGLKLTNKEKGK